MFAFRGVLHDPLREPRPDALELFLGVQADTLGTQFSPSRLKSTCQVIQRTWPEGHRMFKSVRHLMYPPALRREHKTLVQRSPGNNVPMTHEPTPYRTR